MSSPSYENETKLSFRTSASRALAQIAGSLQSLATPSANWRGSKTLNDSARTAETAKSSCSFRNHLDLSAQSWEDTPEEFEPGQLLKSMPGTANFASLHVLINQERIRMGKAPLDRSRDLDDMARQRAQEMAQKGQLFGESQTIQNDIMVENVQKGSSIRFIHQMMVSGVSGDTARANMLNDKFIRFGVGCFKGTQDGLIYVSQIFEAPEPPPPKPRHNRSIRDSIFRATFRSSSTTNNNKNDTTDNQRKSLLNPFVYFAKTKRGQRSARRRNNVHG